MDSATPEPPAMAEPAGDIERARPRSAEPSEPEQPSAAEVPEAEERRALAGTEAMLTKLRLFEGDLVDAGDKLDRIREAIDASAAERGRAKGRGRLRRLGRPESLTRDRLPDGAVLVAARLAREGRSREEVRSFLKESFSGVDASRVIELAFPEESVSA